MKNPTPKLKTTTLKTPDQMGVKGPARPKAGWQDWRAGRTPMSRPGTRKKKLPMPKVPKNLGPASGLGVSGRI